MNILLTVIAVINTTLINLTFAGSIFNKLRIKLKEILLISGFVVAETVSTLCLEKMVYLKLPVNFLLFVLLYMIAFRIGLRRSTTNNLFHIVVTLPLEH